MRRGAHIGSVYVVVMSDLVIRLRKIVAAFGTRGGVVSPLADRP